MKKTPFDQNTLTDLTEEQIEGFKKEYADIWQIEVEDKKCFIYVRSYHAIQDKTALEKRFLYPLYRHFLLKK